MLTVLKAEENYIATRVTEKISQEDYQKILPLVEDQIQKSGKIHWYFEIENFEGWELEGLYQEINFDIKHACEFEKIALVGEKKWTEWLNDMMNPFTTAEVRHFQPSEKEQAKKWIKIGLT